MTKQQFKKFVEFRRLMDETLPTLVHYLGIIVLVYAIFIDHLENPALIPAATGLLLFKAIYGSGDRE